MLANPSTALPLTNLLRFKFELFIHSEKSMGEKQISHPHIQSADHKSAATEATVSAI